MGLDGTWDRPLMRRIGLPENLFPDIAEPGSTLGPLIPEMRAQLGIDEGVRVVSVASHDTASAVAAIPMHAESAAYISCGTWGLVGIELPSAIVNDASRAANFTNEGGADGRVRFLHNVMGLWLLSETIRQFERDGHAADLATLLDQAAAAPTPPAVFDTDDPRFLPPGDMSARISAWYRERGLPAPRGGPEMVRAIVESLAAAFASNVSTAAELSGKDSPRCTSSAAGHRIGCCVNSPLIVLVCRCWPDRSKPPHWATFCSRPAPKKGLITGDLEALRALVAAMFPPQRYTPRTVAAAQPVVTG